METSTVQVDKKGTRRYYNADGQLHRVDGPAVEYPNGTQMWYLDDHLHREAGPAVENASGGRSWWANGIAWTGQRSNTPMAPAGGF